MAFKKGTRRVTARNPKTGRFEKVDLRKSQIRTVSEYNPKRKHKWTKIYGQKKAEPISKSRFIVDFLSREIKQAKPTIERMFTTDLSHPTNRFLMETLSDTGFFDQIFSDIVRSKSPLITFEMRLKEIVLKNGKKYPDMKLNFDFKLDKDQMKKILSGDFTGVDKEFKRIVKVVSQKITKRFREVGIQYSNKVDRNKNPETGKKVRGNKKYDTIQSFGISSKSKYWSVEK